MMVYTTTMAHHKNTDIPKIPEEEEVDDGSITNENTHDEDDEFDMEEGDENPIMTEFSEVLGRVFFTLLATEEGETVMSVIKGMKESMDKQNKILFRISQILEKHGS